MSWKESNNKLVNEITFNTQTELADYLGKVARIADNQNHHPDMMITNCSKLRIELYSHELNQITQKDYHLAGLIDSIPIPKKDDSITSSWDL